MMFGFGASFWALSRGLRQQKTRPKPLPTDFDASVRCSREGRSILSPSATSPRGDGRRQLGDGARRLATIRHPRKPTGPRHRRRRLLSYSRWRGNFACAAFIAAHVNRTRRRSIEQQAALALALLQERDKSNSFWSKYLSTLPGIIPTPLHFNETEQDDLVGTDLLRWVRSRQKHVAKTHAVLLEHLAESAAVDANGASSSFNAPSLDEFTWALSIAWSRGHTLDMAAVRGLGAAKRPGLVPIGDCFNHAEERFANVVTKSDPANGVFDFVAMRDVKTGDELLVSYSLHSEPSNSKLLLDYGFCTPYSLHDEVSVDLQLAGEIKPAMAKLLQALQLTDYVREARLTLGPDSMNPPDALIASGRVLALEEPALSQATVESVLEAQSDASFEVAVLRLLASRIEKRLRQYDREGISSASNEEDEHALAGGAWRYSTGTGCTLHVRAGERRGSCCTGGGGSFRSPSRRRVLTLEAPWEAGTLLSLCQRSRRFRPSLRMVSVGIRIMTFHFQRDGVWMMGGRSLSRCARCPLSSRGVLYAASLLRGAARASSLVILPAATLDRCLGRRSAKRSGRQASRRIASQSTELTSSIRQRTMGTSLTTRCIRWPSSTSQRATRCQTSRQWTTGTASAKTALESRECHTTRCATCCRERLLRSAMAQATTEPTVQRVATGTRRSAPMRELLGRWTALQERLLRPVLHWRVGVPGR